MSSVASETRPILPPRPHAPSARSHSAPDAKEPAIPFAELLDRAETLPVSRQARSERPEQTDRTDQPKPSDDPGIEVKPVDGVAAPQDSKATAGGGETANAKQVTENKLADAGQNTKDKAVVSAFAGKKMKAGEAVVPAEAGKNAEDGEAVVPPDAGGKPDTAADATAPLGTRIVDVAPAAIVPPAPIAALAPLAATAEAEAGAPEASALPALPAATGGVPPNVPSKPSQAHRDQPAALAAKHLAPAAPAAPQAVAPEIDTGKDGQARGNGDKPAGEFRHAAADVLAKPEATAPTQQGGGAGAAVKASADAMQNLGLAAPATTAAAASGAANAPAPAAAPAPTPAPAVAAVPLPGLAVEIATQARAGNNHFDIRLDPPELGRIDVKLDVDGDGNVSTRLVVDRADTLDLLRRDASTLERALQQSGLKTSDHALEFSLRQHGFARHDSAAQGGAQLLITDDDPAPLEAMRQGYGRLLGLGGGLDIRV